MHISTRLRRPIRRSPRSTRSWRAQLPARPSQTVAGAARVIQLRMEELTKENPRKSEHQVRAGRLSRTR